MTDAIAIAASALTTAGRRVATAAHNIANGTTEGYARRETTAVSQATGGVLGVDRPVLPGQAQGVDLVTEVLDAKQAERAYASSATLIRTEAEMMDETLDMVG